MSREVGRLEKQIQSREEYMISLENEAIMLRREIKDAKFHNEKSGYAGFLGGLTQLRDSRDRSKSNPHGRSIGPVADGSGRSVDRKVPSTMISLSNQNSQRPVYDDIPQKDERRNHFDNVRGSNDSRVSDSSAGK